jgi:hypothetical protein
MNFSFNGLVKCLRGEEYYSNGVITFPTEVIPKFPGSVDGHYRTAFGPYVHRHAQIYGNTNHNTQQAVQHRLCQSKFPDNPFARAFEQFFFELQGTTLASQQDIWTEYFEPFDACFADTVEHALEGYDLPHPKKFLRILAMKDLLETGKIGNNLWLKTIWYKAKADEWGKYNKPERFIGDLGVAASLQGFWSTMLVKQFMADHILEVNGVEMEFHLHVTTEGLERAFAHLLCPPKRGYIAIFSDDFTASIRDEDGVPQMHNLDIRKCDFSHSKYIFAHLHGKHLPDPIRDNLKTLVKQLELPCRVHSSENRSHMVLLQRDTAFLYSGSTITTVINTQSVAGICIDLALSGACKGADIERSGLNMGYQLSGWTEEERCKTMYDLQFLKHSPVYDTTGRLRAMLNLGVLLRTSGVSKGDLPGRGPLEPRAAAFQSGILRGMYPNASFELLTRMKANLPVVERRTVNYLFDQLGNDSDYTVSMMEATSRYRLSASDVEILLVLGDAGFGDVLNHRVFHTILHVDYGYPMHQ